MPLSTKEGMQREGNSLHGRAHSWGGARKGSCEKNMKKVKLKEVWGKGRGKRRLRLGGSRIGNLEDQ